MPGIAIPSPRGMEGCLKAARWDLYHGAELPATLLPELMTGFQGSNVLLFSSALMGATLHNSRECPSQHSLNKWFSTCGSRPLSQMSSIGYPAYQIFASCFIALMKKQLK